MTKSYVLVDVNDPRTGRLADVLANKSCKKILGLLAESELSESEISKKLGLPVTTVNYNVKKLVDSGLVEKSKSFLSSKGKYVPVYRVSEKKIVISPKSFMRGIVPAIIGSFIAALGLKSFMSARYTDMFSGAELVQTQSAKIADASVNSGKLYDVLANAPNSWAWFFVGAMVAVVIIVLWNWDRV